MEIEKLLDEREKIHGDYLNHAINSQSLKDALRSCKGWSNLDLDAKESLEMIMHKAARILNSRGQNKDDWVDIAGYSTLISRQFNE